MCNWSNWQFICDGRYDILLAVLTGTALLCSVALMLFSYFGAKYCATHPHGRAFRAARAAFLRGDIGDKRFLDLSKTKK